MSGRVVAVTGAGGGVGRATAVEFARPGDRVALLARGVRGLEGAAREVRHAATGRGFGMHGAFDDRAKSRSVQQWVAHRCPQLAAADLTALGGLAIAGPGLMGVGGRR